MLISLDDWCGAILSVAEDDVAGSLAYSDAETGKMIKRNFGWNDDVDWDVDPLKMKTPDLDDT